MGGEMVRIGLLDVLVFKVGVSLFVFILLFVDKNKLINKVCKSYW